MIISRKSVTMLLTDEQFTLVLKTYVSTRGPSRASGLCKRCNKELPAGTTGRGTFCIRNLTGMQTIKEFCCRYFLHGENPLVNQGGTARGRTRYPERLPENS